MQRLGLPQNFIFLDAGWTIRLYQCFQRKTNLIRNFLASRVLLPCWSIWLGDAANCINFYYGFFIVQQTIYVMHLRDDHWQKLEPLLKGTPNCPGTRGKNNRLFIEALLWVVSNNYAWSNLPTHFGNFNTIYMRFRRWTQSDFWRELASETKDDAELHQMLEQIVRYSDWYTRRAQQRLTRRAYRNNYNAQYFATIQTRSTENFPVEATEPPLHWVSLVVP